MSISDHMEMITDLERQLGVLNHDLDKLKNSYKGALKKGEDPYELGRQIREKTVAIKGMLDRVASYYAGSIPNAWRQSREGQNGR